MAKVHFKPNQPIQSLSGTLGSVTFRTVNGQTQAFQRPEPVLPKNPTRKQRAQFKQRTIYHHQQLSRYPSVADTRHPGGNRDET